MGGLARVVWQCLQRGSMVPDRAFFLAGSIESMTRAGGVGCWLMFMLKVNSERNARTHTEDVISGVERGVLSGGDWVIVGGTVLERSDRG